MKHMTARDKFLNAFTPAGTPEIGVVAAYEDIFIRDHWGALTAVPWWHAFSGVNNEEEMAWARDFSAKSGLEWLTLRPCRSRAERLVQQYEQRADGVWLVDRETGRQTRLTEPLPGGTNTACAQDRPADLDALPATQAAIDKLVPPVAGFDRESFLKEGRHDAVAAIREALDLVLYGHVGSPLWALYNLLGYDGVMVFIAQDPDLAGYAGRRILDRAAQNIRMFAALGADTVWIEECLMDQISPELFWKINVPLVRQCVREIQACGLKSIYYYCGNPNDRLDAILDAGADAVHFEESKKNFTIDIADILTKINGRCAVFGNLDAIGILQDGSENALRSEIKRQMEAAREHGCRFIMSTGSPITPGTTVERVRMYTDIARESGRC